MAEEVVDEVEALHEIFADGDFVELQTNSPPAATDAGKLPVLRFRLRAADDDKTSRAWLWLDVARPGGYPGTAAGISVFADPSVRWVPHCHLTAIADIGRATAQEDADIGQVAVYAIYEAVKDAVKTMLTAPTTAGGDSGGCSPRAAPAALCPLGVTSPPEQALGQSSDKLGVSLRFILAFAELHSVGGFGKWEAPCPEDTTGAVCMRVVKPATESRRVAFTSLGPPYIPESAIALPTHFVSHSWGCPFSSLATALLVHQLGHDVAWAMLEEVVDLGKLGARLEAELACRDLTEYFYWIDVFAKNQHVVESDTTAAELAEMVSGATIGAVMVVHPLRKPRMLSRVWCLFEMHQVSPFTLATHIRWLCCMAW
jgi:hypothetical protein